MPISDNLRNKSLITGVLIGTLSGLLGVGGGIFLIPILVNYFHMEQHKAHAVSLAVVLPTAMASALVYGLRGQVDLYLAATLAIGGVIGASIGARLMHKIPAATLQRLFGILLCLAGVRMVLS